MRHTLGSPHADGDSPLHRLDARVKLLAALALVLACVSTPPRAWPAFLGYLGLLLGGIVASAVPAGYFARRVLLVLPFAVLVAAFVPFMKHGGDDAALAIGPLTLSRAGLLILWGVTAKASIAVLTVTLLSATTPVAALLDALARLRAPRVLVMLLGVTYRYLFVLVDEAGRMKRARDARCYGGRWLWQSGVVGRMVGTLFLRSLERGERVHAAMLARGFDGTAVVGRATRLRSADWAALVSWAVVLVLLRASAA